MKQVDFWTTLLRNTKRLPPRFKLKAPNTNFYEEDSDSEEEPEVAAHPGLMQSLRRRLSVSSRRFSGSIESFTSQGSNKSRDFLDSTDEQRSVAEVKKQNMTIDRLASHLQNHLPREARVKIQNIAIEYVKCQVGVVGIIRGSVHTTQEEF